MNFIVLSGYVGATPVIKTVNGKEIVTFSLGVKNVFSGETTWFNCTVWGGGIKEYVINYVTRGTRLELSGSVTINITKGSCGKTHQYPSVNVTNLISCHGKKGLEDLENKVNNMYQNSNKKPFNQQEANELLKEFQTFSNQEKQEETREWTEDDAILWD